MPDRLSGGALAYCRRHTKGERVRLTPRGTRTSELRRIRQREEPQRRWYEGLEPASGQGPVRYGPTGRWRRNEGWRAGRAAPTARKPLLYFINRTEHDGARERRQRAWAGYGGAVGEESTRNVGVHYVVLPTSTSMNKSPSRCSFSRARRGIRLCRPPAPDLPGPRPGPTSKPPNSSGDCMISSRQPRRLHWGRAHRLSYNQR